MLRFCAVASLVEVPDVAAGGFEGCGVLGVLVCATAAAEIQSATAVHAAIGTNFIGPPRLKRPLSLKPNASRRLSCFCRTMPHSCGVEGRKYYGRSLP